MEEEKQEPHVQQQQNPFMAGQAADLTRQTGLLNLNQQYQPPGNASQQMHQVLQHVQVQQPVQMMPQQPPFNAPYDHQYARTDDDQAEFGSPEGAKGVSDIVSAVRTRHETKSALKRLQQFGHQ